MKFLRFFHSPQNGRLVRHYFLASTILISAGLITSGVIEIYYRHRESWELYALIQQEITVGAAFKIEQFVHEIQRDMRAATRNTDVVEHGLSPEFQRELRRLLVNSPAITEAVAFDLNGIKRAAARRAGPILTEANWAHPADAALEKGKQGKPYFGPVYYSEGAGAFMKITVPIERFVGEIIGVLQCEIDLRHVHDVISAIQVGKAGHAYLVTRSGDLITHGDLSRVIQKRNLAYLDQVGVAIRADAIPSAPNALVAKNVQGATVFTSHISIPSLDWLVFTEQPINEVYAPLYASMLRTSGVLMIGLGVALLATLFVSRRVVRPLETLRHGVERIRRGDLKARLDIKTGDEIELLADEFNKMTEHLSDAYTGLEHKVAQRTQALTETNEKLEEANHHKSQFLANVNHELRTPLSSIIGYARLLRRETEGQISLLQRENLEDLLRNAERLLGLIDSLLDFAKIEAGKIEVQLEPVRLDELIQGAAATIEPMLNKNSVRLVRDVPRHLMPLYTDREKLRQIILNLLGNAVKFTEHGEIKIIASQQNGSMQLVVSDTGIGIGKEDLNKIFEEFYQADLSTNKYRGTGLGLAIVKRFVSLLGGKIDVASEEGKGANFTVTLPLDHEDRPLV